MQLPLLILITGPPAAGKTVLARRLADKLRLPLIAKDTLKERLYDSIGWSDPNLNRQLGGAAFDLIYELLEEQLRAHRSLTVEAAFWKDSSGQILRHILARNPARVIEFHCTSATEILATRYTQREHSHDRHPGHKTVESASRDEFSDVINSGRYDALSLTDEVAIIDTSDFQPADFERIEQEPAALLSGIVGADTPTIPNLILVTGPPGAGKSVLARRLADHLRLPLIATDTLKERLYDALGWSDQALHDRIGTASYDLLYSLTEEQLRAGSSLIVESVFWKEPNLKTFRKIVTRHPATVTELHCTADAETLFGRVLSRDQSQLRHPGHGARRESDHAEFNGAMQSDLYGALRLSEDTTIIDTSDFALVNFGQIEIELADRLL